MSDLRIQYDEEMVGTGHPTKDDTLNRLHLADHAADGSGGHLDRGRISGLAIVWDSAAQLTVGGGSIGIGGYTYALEESVAVPCSGLSAATWYYLFAQAPASGRLLGSGEISHTATGPSFDAALGGWYDAAKTKRCFGVFRTGGTGNILRCYSDGGWFQLGWPLTVLDTSSPAVSGTLINAGTPPALGGGLLVQVRGTVHHPAVAPAFLYLNAVNEFGLLELAVQSVAGVRAVEYNTYFSSADSQFAYSGTSASTVYVGLCGFRLPAGMAR